MFHAEWVPVEGANADAVIEKVHAAASYRLPEGKTVVKATTLPFYPAYTFYSLADTTLSAPNERFALIGGDDDVVVMDWSNEPLYALNERLPIVLDRKTVIPYARFFFHFVRGQLGRFIIVETPAEVVWEIDAPMSDKDAVNPHITPVVYNGIGRDNLYTLTAIVVFKNALFKTDIKIAPEEMNVQDEETGQSEMMTIGQMKLVNEELLLEDLHIPIDPPPTEFG